MKKIKILKTKLESFLLFFICTNPCRLWQHPERMKVPHARWKAASGKKTDYIWHHMHVRMHPSMHTSVCERVARVAQLEPQAKCQQTKKLKTKNKIA